MKATGIVRRIDDLGRVVVPKEIRRTLRIREGDPLEIFTDREGEIILKKYSPIGELSQFAKDTADALAQAMGHTICIVDRDQVIAVAGSGKRELEGKPISKPLEKLIEERERVNASSRERNYVKIAMDGSDEFEYEAMAPIISEGDVIGAVLICEKDEKKSFGDLELKMAQASSVFLGRQMEN